MTKISQIQTGKVVAALLESGAQRVTRFVSDKLTIKATRVGRWRKNARANYIAVTIGAPNYAEREFIRKCKRAGEPFPVRKLQLKHAP